MKFLDKFFSKYNWYRRLFKNEVWISSWIHKFQGGLQTYERLSTLHNKNMSTSYKHYVKYTNLYDEFLGKDIYDTKRILSILNDHSEELNIEKKRLKRILNLNKLNV